MAHYDGYYFGYVSYITFVPGAAELPTPISIDGGLMPTPISMRAGFKPLAAHPKGGLPNFLTLSDIEKDSYEYKVFPGIAPDAFGAYIPFGFKSLFMSIIANGDIVIDFTRAGTDPYVVYHDKRKDILVFEAEGFRISNLIPGSNIPYQLVIFR